MTTFFQRTFKRLFRGWFGWGFAAILLFAAGVTAFVNNLKGGSTSFSLVFAVLSETLIVLIPVMTCVVYTNERRTGEDAWLRSFPVSDAARFLGNYAALFAAFLIPTAVTGLLPLLFSSFGAISLGAAYAAWFGYVLFGATILAICSFIASRTSRRVLSVLLGIAVCAAFALSAVITGFMERKAWISALVLGLLFAALAVLVWFRARKKRLPAILTFAIPAVVLAVLAFAAPRVLTDRLPPILHLFSPYARLSGFLGGHFNVPSLIYGVAVVGFFLFFAVFRASLRPLSVPRVAAACGAAVLAVVVSVGALFLPFRAAYPDVTGRNTFRLSDVSRTALSSLDGNVTLRYLSNGGKQDVDLDLYSLVVQYAEASPHIRVETVDIGTDATFREMDAETRAYVDQSVIVSGRRNRLILRSDIYYYAYTEGEMTMPFTLSDYQQMLYALASRGDAENLNQFMEATSVRLSFETMLTNAVLFAARERAPRVAVVGDELDRFLEQHLLQSGYGLDRAAISDAFGANAVICNLTANDLTEADAAALGAYLAGGGKLLLMANTSRSMPNLVNFLTEQGILDAEIAKNPHVDATGSVVGSYGRTFDLENESGGRLVFVAANVDSSYNALSRGGDFDYLRRAVNWLTDFEGTRINIVDPVLPTSVLKPNAVMLALWGVMLIAVLPAAAVALGVVTRYIRKQKTAV